MDIAAEHAGKLVAFMALSPRERVRLLHQAGWADKAVEEGTVAKQLLAELAEYLRYLQSNDEWYDRLQTDTISNEIDALASLLLVVAARFAYVGNRLFERVEAMETEPEWLLIWRLAKELARLLDIAPGADVEYVPHLICG